MYKRQVDKVRELRELITVTGSEALIEVDGGVNLDTGSRLVDACLLYTSSLVIAVGHYLMPFSVFIGRNIL